MWFVQKVFANTVVSVLLYITDPNASALLVSLVLDVKSTLMNALLHPVLMVVPASTYLKVTGKQMSPIFSD